MVIFYAFYLIVTATNSLNLEPPIPSNTHMLLLHNDLQIMMNRLNAVSNDYGIIKKISKRQR